jgi:hypothetical protein
VTLPGNTPDEPGTRRQADDPHVPAPRLADDYENWRELQDEPHDPYDLLDPDDYGPWRKHGPKFHIVVAKAVGWDPGGPPSLDELLENLARTRDPEPDLEAEL